MLPGKEMTATWPQAKELKARRIMQIVEASSDGLKRTLKVNVPAADIAGLMTAKLNEVKDQVQVKGFRKGKVPVDHVRKLYGKALMGEVLDQAIRDTSAEAIKERKERAAAQPQIELADKHHIDDLMAGKVDLAYVMTFEVLPEIKIADFESLKLEKLVAEPDADSLTTALAQLQESGVAYEAVAEGETAAKDDRVTIDYKGTIDGEAIEGGEGEGLSLVLGNAGFIPGFEDGLMGTKAGDERTINARFPAEYPVESLAGKDAIFEVKVRGVEHPKRPELNDEFATKLGAENLDKLKEMVTADLKRDLERTSRTKLKRELLDSLEKAHPFELPPTLVAREFDSIWNQLTKTLESQGKTLADEGKSEEEARAEYQKIAARRVRLGLVVGEIGNIHKIEVTQDEMRRALIMEARRYPGQEKNVYEFYEKTPGALQELRAPIFEDKVVDLIIEKAKPSERAVSREELLKAVEEVTQAA
jgi:trigger factor